MSHRSHPSRPASWRAQLATVLIGSLLLLLLYGRAFRLQMVGDDFIWLYDGFTTRHLADLFAFRYFDFIRPLSHAWFWLGTTLFGTQRAGFQAAQLLVHGLTAWLLARYVTRWWVAPSAGTEREPASAGGSAPADLAPSAPQPSDEGAAAQSLGRGDRLSEDVAGLAAGWLAALAWLCMARHVESVCWPAAVGEVLVAPCMLLALLFQHRALVPCPDLEAAAPTLRAGLLLSLEAALLAKESAVSMLPLLVLQHVRLAGTKRLHDLLLPALLVGLTCAWEGSSILARRGDLGYSTLAFRSIDFYVSWSAHVMSLLLGRGGVPWLDAHMLAWGGQRASHLLWLALGTGFLLAMARVARWGSALGWYLAWMALAALPYAAFLPHGVVVSLEPYDRYTYLPSLALAALLGHLGACLWLGCARSGKVTRLACNVLLLSGLVVGVRNVRQEVLGNVARAPTIPQPERTVPRLLAGRSPEGRVYCYVPADLERYPASALALYGGLPREQVVDWYEMLRSGGLAVGDKAIFYSVEEPARFVDLTLQARAARQALPRSVLSPEPLGEVRRSLGVLAAWHKAPVPTDTSEHALRAAPLDQLFPTATRQGEDAPGAQGSEQVWRVTPPRDISPLLVQAIELRFAMPPPDERALYVGWSPTLAAGGEGALQPHLAPMEAALQPQAARSADRCTLWFFPSLKAGWMRVPRWERLWIGMPRDLAPHLEGVRVLGLGKPWSTVAEPLP